jgi:2-amino-4-hydroxy-6-hydroxymethyldihydropteridine diphosphokinase
VNNAYLHLGSNEGNRIEMLEKAIVLIEKKIGKVKMKSSLYETEAWGLKDQPDFINQAIQISTPESAHATLNFCKEIETQLGGVKKEKWGPRSIDIDLLFFNDEVIDKEHIKIPHPQIENRNFVLIPLMEIAGDFVHPILKKSIEEIFDECEDECEVVMFEE